MIFENFDLENIDKYFNKIERMKKYNQKSSSVVMLIDYGYAKAKEGDDLITNVIDCADSLIYKHKMAIKS